MAFSPNGSWRRLLQFTWQPVEKFYLQRNAGSMDRTQQKILLKQSSQQKISSNLSYHSYLITFSIRQKYLSVTPLLKTGDVVAFEGYSFVSEIIKLTTKSQFSHVGIIVVKDNEIFIYESTCKPITPDVLFKKWYKGVHCFNFLQRILTYPGRISVFPLKNKLAIENEKKLIEYLDNNHRNNINFNVNGMQFLGLKRIGLPVTIKEETMELLFCSQMVTAALKQGKVLNNEINSTLQTPYDVINFPCFSDSFVIKNSQAVFPI